MLRHTFGLSALLAASFLLFAPACDAGADEDTDDTANTTTTGSGVPCGTEWADKDGTTPSIMDEWGAPCLQDEDCMPILGEGAVCVQNILGVYDLPGGFCSKYCELPDSSTTFVRDAPDCSADGGVTCIGAKDIFTACIIECESSDQCGREGYGCRPMPTLAAEGDPSFCLMSTADCCTTDSGECE